MAAGEGKGVGGGGERPLLWEGSWQGLGWHLQVTEPGQMPVELLPWLWELSSMCLKPGQGRRPWGHYGTRRQEGMHSRQQLEPPSSPPLERGQAAAAEGLQVSGGTGGGGGLPGRAAAELLQALGALREGWH